MHYIVFDLEFNQDIPSLREPEPKRTRYPFEIIQIGAVKLDASFQTISNFNRYVKPTIYEEISSFVTELTGITAQKLSTEELFPEVFNSFIEFINDSESIYCVWGMADLKELYRNAEYHNLDIKKLPKRFINLQPYASLHFGYPSSKLLQLKNTVTSLNIPTPYEFHSAYHDAYYTAEILKKIYNSSISPSVYDPNFIKLKARKSKKEIDYPALLKQFEKMYNRSMTEEEQSIIITAYKMGRTQQFLK